MNQLRRFVERLQLVSIVLHLRYQIWDLRQILGNVLEEKSLFLDEILDLQLHRVVLLLVYQELAHLVRELELLLSVVLNVPREIDK